MKRRGVRIGSVMATIGVLVAGSGALLAPAVHAEKAAAAEQKTEARKIVKYVGSSESKDYHKPACDLVKKIGKAHRVEFASAAEAKKAGYAPCKICLPPKTVTQATTGVGALTGTVSKTDTKAADAKATKTAPH